MFINNICKWLYFLITGIEKEINCVIKKLKNKVFKDSIASKIIRINLNMFKTKDGFK
jgi:hypothetical protein